jgi:hypothetical protein
VRECAPSAAASPLQRRRALRDWRGGAVTPRHQALHSPEYELREGQGHPKKRPVYLGGEDKPERHDWGLGRHQSRDENGYGDAYGDSSRPLEVAPSRSHSRIVAEARAAATPDRDLSDDLRQCVGMTPDPILVQQELVREACREKRCYREPRHNTDGRTADSGGKRGGGGRI